MFRLLIDAGNSLIKWTLADAQNNVDLVQRHAVLKDMIELWRSIPAPQQAWLVSVRDVSFNMELATAVNQLWSLPTQQVCSSAQALGVTNAYLKPEQLGNDRWAAMLGAYHQQQSSVLVVNVGTAVTIDAINETGQHLGGLLSPGLHLQKEALLAGTRIKCSPSRYDAEINLFAWSTEQGMASGSVHAISALIDRCFQTLQASTGLPSTCYLAGGDAELIKDTLQCPYIYEPSLVLKGLALISVAEKSE